MNLVLQQANPGDGRYYRHHIPVPVVPPRAGWRRSQNRRHSRINWAALEAFEDTIPAPVQERNSFETMELALTLSFTLVFLELLCFCGLHRCDESVHGGNRNAASASEQHRSLQRSGCHYRGRMVRVKRLWHKHMPCRNSVL